MRTGVGSGSGTAHRKMLSPMKQKTGDPPSYVEIKPARGWQLLQLRELAAFKDMFAFLVWRDITVLYRQTVLGVLWAIIRPMSSMLIFTVIFGKLAKLPSDGIPYPVFSFAALVPWTYFASTLSKSTESLYFNRQLITRVYFPRIILPMVPVVAGLMDFFIALLTMMILMAIYGIMPSSAIFHLPLMILIMLLTASGIGIWLSALAIQYRDIKFVLQFIVQVLMYAAPVVWPASLIPDEYRLLYGCYPMAGVIEGFRASLIGAKAMPWDLITCGAISSLALFFAGAYYFRMRERFFADVI